MNGHILNLMLEIVLACMMLVILVLIAKDGGVFILEPNKYILYAEIALALGIVGFSAYSLYRLLRRLILHK